MAVAVDIYITSDDVVPQPLVGVVAGIYNTTTLALIATATSDGSGRAAFLLPGSVSPGTAYEVRFYKSGVEFSNPKAIAVIEPAAPANINVFDVTGTLGVLAPATDPYCCRCTGVFVDVSNRPMKNVRLRIVRDIEAGYQTPRIVSNNLIASEALDAFTDASGKVSFDLIRGGQYYMMMAAEEDNYWPFHVPDRSAMNLIDLIHPQPVSISWDQGDAPANAVTLSLSSSPLVRVHFTALMSNFDVLTNDVYNWLEMNYPSPAPFSATVTLGSDGYQVVEITALSVGSASITPILKSGLYPVRVPDYSITAPALGVTVTS
jgi:hypothetical protein